ncbi:MAG: DHHA1 domain-containing protein, partial [Thermomicrobiales bacterium]
INIDDTHKPTPEVFVHRGMVSEGFVRVGETVTAEVDASRRQSLRRNHTATHLLHWALQQVVGPEARQAGSLVAPDRLRFDFASMDAVKPEQLARITDMVNGEILSDQAVVTDVKAYADAVAGGATALFGEKYGAEVRVVSIGGFSQELCGGTHVSRIGEFGPFMILSEGSVAAGVRRIEAMTGEAAIERLHKMSQVLESTGRSLRTTWMEAPAAIEALQERTRSLEREIERLRGEIAGARAGDLLDRVVNVGGLSILAARVDADGKDALRQLGDRLRDRIGSGVVLLGAVIDGRPSLLALATPDAVARGVKAGDIVREAAAMVDGKGGGRPDLAEAGGKDPEKLDDAIAAVIAIVERSLAG